ncbi:MAG TPA: hypothetical protein VG347_08445 [Verrucomicrobiae bacterium]|nr:hypothetical protein [Verrucomicrobiae bacterium]
MTSPNLVQGRLSLGSYIKVFVIGAIGILPVLATFYGIAILVSAARGTNVDLGLGATFPVSGWWHLWPVWLFMALGNAVSIVVSGFFLGLCSYPFYAWLCRRGCGIVLKGKFDVIL